MLSVKLSNGKVVAYSYSIMTEDCWTPVTSLNDYDLVVSVAEQLSTITREHHLPVDYGNGNTPRFDVVQSPKTGQEVFVEVGSVRKSCGEIIRKTEDNRVLTTKNGFRFFRKRNTNSWFYRKELRMEVL